MAAMASFWTAFAVAVSALRPLQCPKHQQLFASYESLDDTLSNFLGLYSGYSHGRAKTVAEHIRLFQLNSLAQDFLDILEAFRLFACMTLCPQTCDETISVRLVEKLNNLQLDLELILDDSSQEFRAASQLYLREAKSYAASLFTQAGQIDWDEAQATCVARVASRILFPAMQVLSLQSKGNESQIILSGVSEEANHAAFSASYISQKEISFTVLRSLATFGAGLRLYMGPGGKEPPSKDLCGPLSPFLSKDGDTSTESGWPRRWRFNAYNSEAVPRVVQLLDEIEAAHMELSHSFIALRPLGVAWAQNVSCIGKDVRFDPSLCLEMLGFGGHIYSVNIHPPYKGELRIAGRRLGDVSQAAQSSYYDVLHPYGGHHFETVSIEHLFHRMDVVWRQSPEPSPDLFFLHPATHNCYAIEYLFSGAPIKPKILIVPINPIIPPPFEVTPRFEAWWHVTRQSFRSTSLAKAWIQHSEEDSVAEPSPMDEYVTAAMWLGQCSLAAVNRMLERMQVKKFRYILHHVSGAYAIYMRKDIQKAFARELSEQLFTSWLRGWHCMPSNRFFSKLELLGGQDMARLADPSLSARTKEKILCHFLDRQTIIVQQRNFDCEKHLAQLDSEVQNCVRPDHRGWGNDAKASESLQDSVGACEAHCKESRCSYWTYDPTAAYGQPLCWIWVGGRPAEIKSERGWISGDADCKSELSLPALPKADHGPVVTDLGNHDHGEIFKHWAINLMPEIPGTRYFLESTRRGRCVEAFCECFPPFRGPLCQEVDDSPQDRQRNFTAVLHYLTSDDAVDIEDLQHSLPRLWGRFNRRFDYPVVIFHDGLSQLHRERVVNASKNRIWFAYVDDYLKIPKFITEDPSRKAALQEIKWSLGYRGMCRFRSGSIFMQPVLQNFQYAMTLDTDGYFPAEVSSDPIAAMHLGGYVYTWSHLLPDLPGAVRHFWDHSLMYMKMKGIDPRGTPILRQFVREEDVQWTYQLYMNDIEIVQLDWFRSDPYQDYFKYLDSMGGFWLHRWGDHAVRTIAVGMWLPEEKVFEMDVPYGHQNYCRCSGAHPHLSCVREEDVGGAPGNWWICAGQGALDDA